MYPQLRADLTSADFPGAFYENKVRTRGNTATVTNKLINAPDLESLMALGKAKWSIEIRSPSALWSNTAFTCLDDKTVKWSSEDTGSEVFIISGLVAITDVSLSTARLNPAWQDNDTVEIPKGAWLARGHCARTQASVSSILKFQHNQALPNGRMEIAGPDDQYQFIVSVATDLFARCSNRDVQIAALIGVMGKMPTVADAMEEGIEPPMYRSIREKLEDEEVSTWEDPDGYDAATAATVLEPFREEQEEDEE